MTVTVMRFAAAMIIGFLFTSCTSPTEIGRRSQASAVVLLVTPKIFPDFSQPEAAVADLFRHYEPLISKASETIVILAVGNSDHILGYRGLRYWGDTVEWARTTDHVAVSDRILDYNQIAGIRRALQTGASAAGIKLKVFEHIDSGSEFTLSNDFKYRDHQECTSNQWGSYDIRGRLHADRRVFATAPSGIREGTLCGEFLADQVGAYIGDLGFDGIMYDNQLGTRGRWFRGNGPGYSVVEADAISAFLSYSRSVLNGKQLMWFDSYNPVTIERSSFSFPEGGYAKFDYLIASGFCVIMGKIQGPLASSVDHYGDNLTSKLRIGGPPLVLATLDYVDPWYSYESMTQYSGCTDRLEEVAIDRREEIDGVMFFAHDHAGNFVPRQRVESFTSRFFSAATAAR
ncbi:MAG TPA: hypothetical protein VNJ04_13275 [Gemmatimonadaceae bacterium]|nr:hypothetical protein [Gemmatimonadaceae bacterium]